MKGGEYLGQGTYGCTISPTPQCVTPEWMVNIGKKKPAGAATVAKIMTINTDFELEIERAKQLAAIDPTQQVFIYPTSYCYTTPGEFKKVKDSNKCDPNTLRGKQYGVLKMHHGGVTALQHVKTGNRTHADIVKLLLPVVKGTGMLSRRGLLHHDLKPDNIMVRPSSASEGGKIIDFGLMIEVKDAFGRKNPYLRSNYWLHPPEYRIYVQMMRNNWEISDVRSIVRDELRLINVKFDISDTRSLMDAITLPPMFNYVEYEKEIKSFLRSLKRLPNEQDKQRYFEKNAAKVDVYSVGLTMLYLTSFVREYEIATEHYRMYYSILRGMLHPNPSKRYGIRKVYMEFERFLSLSS